MADLHSTRECVHCGTPFQIKIAPGRKRRHCSPECKAFEGVSKTCEWCGSAIQGLTPRLARMRRTCSRSCASHLKAKEAGRQHRIKNIFCAGCHKQVVRTVKTSRDSGRYCSRACAFAVKSRVSAERAALRRIGDRRRASARALYETLVAPEIDALRRIARRATDPAKNIICKHCGSEARRKRPFFRFCSLGCQRQSRLERRQAYKQSEAHKSYRRAAKSRRRARMRGAKAERIDPVKVFERDKWRCHLCGTRTLKSKRGTLDDRAPELEHIVSLADGGTHTWGNVACSCRKCNLEKGAESRGQLGFSIA